MTGPAYDASSNCLALFEVVFMETAGYIIVGAICERITFGAFLLCELFIGRVSVSDLRLLGLGRRLDVADLDRRCTGGTATWISRDRASCTAWAGSAPWRCR